METAQSNEIRFYRASGKYGFMSNLYCREIEFEGKKFRSSEDAYQYGKPRKIEVAEWLISAPKPHLCAAAAHSLFVFDVKSEWNEVKVERMKKVLLEKFMQHEDLKVELLSTGDAMLIEDSKMDSFWGVGRNGKGKNMLGSLLMEVREMLRNS